jgi:GTPase SAR1 family protein
MATWLLMPGPSTPLPPARGGGRERERERKRAALTLPSHTPTTTANPPGPSLPGLESAGTSTPPHRPPSTGPPRVKLVLLGDSGVGKSCLALRLARGEFDAASAVTVGAAFLSTTLALPSSSSVRLDIWDTAGQERYASLAPLYYRGARAAAVVYSVTDRASFDRAGHWVRELAAHCGRSGGGVGERRRGEDEVPATSSSTGAPQKPAMVVALVANKTDAAAGDRVVSREEGAAAAAAAGLLFFETSAASGDGVRAAFEGIAAAVVRDRGGG